MKRTQLLFYFIFFISTSVFGRIIYVKPNPTGTGSGLSWDNAASLQNAMGAAQYWETAEVGIAVTGDQIWVAMGTYKPTGGTDRFISFRMKNGVAVYGGFSGTETELSQRNFSVNETILSGEIGTADSTDNSGCVIHNTGLDNTALIDGFTICGSFPALNSCGMYNENSSPTVLNCTFKNNIGDNGGGMDNDNSAPAIINCFFIGNTGGFGGGICCRNNSSPIISNCVFSGNTGDSGPFAVSGGICNFDSSPEIVNCTFSHNYSGTGQGHGLFNYNSSTVVKNTIFWGKSPQINNEECTPDITYSCIKGGYTGEGNISYDPCFADADGADNIYGTIDDDLRLKDRSRCIGAGTSGSGIPILDIAGSTRGTPLDIGAYENSLSSPMPPLLIYVNVNASGSNNGTNWPNAFTSLQSAIDEASGGDVIWVAGGTYKPTSGNDRTSSFSMKDGVEIYGGFAGGESSLGSRNYIANPTILSGDIGVSGNDDDNSYHVILNAKDLLLDSMAVLDGFIISGGNADNIENIFQTWGGGIYNSYASPKIVNCTFSGNNASGGGAIMNDGSSPILTNCTFINNAGDEGGGIMNQSFSAPAISNCTFTANTADLGGGIYNYSSSSVIVNGCIFSSNTVLDNGGGIYNNSSSPTIENCIFINNSADQYGGGISNDLDSSPSISNCIFNGNSAGSSGGGMNNIAGTTPSIFNCTFSFNTAPAGGGMNNYTEYFGSSSPIVKNTIFWGNSSQISGGTASNFTYCCIQDGNPAYTGTGNIFTNPLFADADGADNIHGTIDDDLRLLNNSFCIGAGTTGSGIPQNDITGITRGTSPDIGAYENCLDFPTIFVKYNASGMNNGANWNDAYSSLQTALAASVSRNHIWVAKGTYKPTTDDDRSVSFQMKNGVSIYGGFAGTETSLTARNYTINQTILSGDIGIEGESTDNSYHVFFHPSNLSLDTSVVIDGFTIRGGNASRTDDPHNFGGGICNIGSSPKIANCILSNNYANEGSGMYNEDSSPMITNCSFSFNSANSGGGMFNINSSPSIVGCTFNNNSASGGGGIYNHHSSSPVISGCIFNNNSSLYEGGGIYSFYSSSIITNCIFSDNSASAGGGMYSYYDSSPKIINCTFSGNSAYSGGALAYYSSGSPIVKNTILWGNYQTGTNNVSEVYSYNIIPGFTYCCIQGGDAGTYPGTGNIFIDPLFADAANGNYHLSAGSPCISAGLNPAEGNYVPSSDIGGRSRPMGSRTDIGAYECDDAALPVELVSFFAQMKEGNVILNWKTAIEVNNYGFEVERQVGSMQFAVGNQKNPQSAIPNPQWELVGFVEGNGNSNAPREYSFIDAYPPAGNLQYRLKQIDTDGNYEYYSQIAAVNSNITSVEKQMPTEFLLSQNYPNPFNPVTTINYELPVSSNVKFTICNSLGEVVKEFGNPSQNAGYYSIKFDGANLSSGVYFCVFEAKAFDESNSFKKINKMLLLK